MRRGSKIGLGVGAIVIAIGVASGLALAGESAAGSNPTNAAAPTTIVLTGQPASTTVQSCQQAVYSLVTALPSDRPWTDRDLAAKTVEQLGFTSLRVCSSSDWLAAATAAGMLRGANGRVNEDAAARLSARTDPRHALKGCR